MNDKSAEAALSEAIEALSECEEYFDNRADADCDQDGFIPNKEMRLLSVVRTALQALENGTAGLADAHTNPPLSDLSSLRKGAEVAGWRPMSTAPKDGTRIDAWVRSTEQPGKEYRHCGAYWNAVQGEWQLGSYHVGQFEHRPEVTHWMPIPERPIDAALVSGSREDGDGTP